MARTKSKTKPARPKTAKTVKSVKARASSPLKASAAKRKAAPKAAASKKAPAKKKVAPKASKSLGKRLKVAATAAVHGLAKVAPAVAGAATLATAAATLASSAKTSGKSRAKAPATTEYSQLLSPLEDRLLVLIEAPVEKTTGGLFIPGTVAERPNRGRVVAVGRGVRNKKGQLRPLDVSVGETVLFAESAGSKLTLAGSELLVIRGSELLGVVG